MIISSTAVCILGVVKFFLELKRMDSMFECPMQIKPSVIATKKEIGCTSLVR